MAELINLNITLPNPAAILTQFSLLKVYRSILGTTGPYTELTTASGATARIPIVATQTAYQFADPAGNASYFYAVSYFNPTTGAESSLSDVMQGSSDPALDIVSVADLKTNYLFGLDLTDPQGQPMPDSLFEFYIKTAVSNLEKRLDIPIRPISIVDERHDYYPEDFRNWCYVQLDYAPCIQIAALRLQLPGGATPVPFPTDSLNLDLRTGTLQVVPTASGTLILPLSSTGLAPQRWMSQRMIPNALRVDYSAGFPPDSVPLDLVEAISMMASYGPLNIAGDLLGGAGIASSSLGIDGLSQSINTTSSPMFSGYGARLVNYTKELDAMIPLLRRHYKGVGMRVV